MLPKQYRLVHDKDFSRLFTKGRAFFGHGITMKVINSKVPGVRVGFVVSTKISKKAVVRNSIKRRMRAIVGKRIAAISGNVDMAFMAKPEIKDMDYAQMETVMTMLLVKTGLLKPV